MRSTNTEKTSEKVAEILFDAGSIIFRPKQPFKFDSGIISPVYVDNRLLISQPKQRNKIIGYLAAQVTKLGKPDVIAGVATAGIAHAAWISQKLNLPMVYVRPKPKDHGRENQVEGLVKKGQKVLVVEDMVSTAGSSINAINALKKLGAKVTDEIAIYTHGMKDSEKNFKAAKVKFHALTNLMTVAQVAQKKGFLKQEQINSILDWSKDPQNWGKKMGFE